MILLDRKVQKLTRTFGQWAIPIGESTSTSDSNSGASRRLDKPLSVKQIRHQIIGRHLTLLSLIGDDFHTGKKFY